MTKQMCRSGSQTSSLHLGHLKNPLCGTNDNLKENMLLHNVPSSTDQSFLWKYRKSTPQIPLSIQAESSFSLLASDFKQMNICIDKCLRRVSLVCNWC